MKRIVNLLTFLFFAGILSAQVPDTVYIENVTDSTARVVQEFTFPDGSRTVNKSPQMDSVQVAATLTRSIYRNEERLHRAIRGIKNSQGLNPLYPVINGLLQEYAGTGYLNLQRQRMGQRFVGYWRITLNQSTVYMALDRQGNAGQVDAQGNPVIGGYSGTWGPADEESFILVNFLPTNILPQSERIVSKENGANEFYTLNTVLKFEYLRPLN